MATFLAWMTFHNWVIYSYFFDTLNKKASAIARARAICRHAMPTLGYYPRARANSRSRITFLPGSRSVPPPRYLKPISPFSHITSNMLALKIEE